MSKSLNGRFPLLMEYIGYSDEPTEILNGKKYAEFLRSKKDILGVAQGYLGSRLHDSWVRSVKNTGDDLSFVLNDFSTKCFCDALATTAGVPVPKSHRIFPLHLIFKDIKRVSLYRHFKGKLMPVNPKAALRNLDEFLYDEIVSIDTTKIEIGMLFWTSGNQGGHMLCHVEAQSINVRECQRSAFLKAFEGHFMSTFDRYWLARQSGYYFDYSTALKFLEKNPPQMG